MELNRHLDPRGHGISHFLVIEHRQHLIHRLRMGHFDVVTVVNQHIVIAVTDANKVAIETQ